MHQQWCPADSINSYLVSENLANFESRTDLKTCSSTKAVRDSWYYEPDDKGRGTWSSLTQPRVTRVINQLRNLDMKTWALLRPKTTRYLINFYDKWTDWIWKKLAKLWLILLPLELGPTQVSPADGVDLHLAVGGLVDSYNRVLFLIQLGPEVEGGGRWSNLEVSDPESCEETLWATSLAFRTSCKKLFYRWLQFIERHLMEVVL